MAKEPGGDLKPARLTAAVHALGALLKRVGLPDVRDALVFGGLACACYGIGEVYAPAAWIAGGAALFWLGVRS